MSPIAAVTLAFAVVVAVDAFRRTNPPPGFAGVVVLIATALLTLWLCSAILLRLPGYRGAEPDDGRRQAPALCPKLVEH